MTIEGIIRHEPECSYVEFKSEQYLEKRSGDFVKDMMAMANSHYEGSKYIIVGVKEKGGQKTFEGMSKPLEDPSRYDQVVHQNVEPEIRFSCRMVEADGLSYGVFIIENCNDRPYMMKKDFHDLRQGETYIRRGTTNFLLTRRDLDAIWDQKLKTSRFDGDVKVLCTVESQANNLISIQQFVILPSERHARVIERTINDLHSRSPIERVKGLDEFYWGYSLMDTEELEDHLSSIKATYHDEDLFEKFEVLGAKVNFVLSNTGSSYIEDVTVDILIPALPGLEIAPKEHYKGGAMIAAAMNISSFGDKSRQYPSVKLNENQFEIRQRLNQLRHGIETSLFGIPIRVFADQQMAGKTIEAKITIHGKNLTKALQLEVPIRFAELDANPTGQ
jgi:schlafen family protein